LKTMFYIMCSMAEDEETQRRGVVCMIYYVGQKLAPEIDFEFATRAARLLEWLPIRFSAIHWCSDHPGTRAFKALLVLLLGHRNRARFRIHDGMLI
jgi:hypothetical protein